MFDDENLFGQPRSPIVIKTSGSWESNNWQRCVQINDELDKLSFYDKRVFFKTLSKEEASGILPEYNRRRNNEIARPGCVVKCLNVITVYVDDTNCESHRYSDYALVIGNLQHGGYDRILCLFKPVNTLRGNRIFARASISCITEYIYND